MPRLPPTQVLFSQYGGMVLRRARALLGDEQAGRDAAPEGFPPGPRSQAPFRARAAPGTWRYRITTNVCRNVVKGGGRRPEALEEGPELMVPEGVGLDERLAIHAVLARVPEPLREIATYFYLDQLSHEEIAKLLNVSRRTVGNRLVEFHAAADQLTRQQKKVMS